MLRMGWNGCDGWNLSQTATTIRAHLGGANNNIAEDLVDGKFFSLPNMMALCIAPV